MTLRAGGGVAVAVDTSTGAYTVSVDGAQWLSSGAWDIVGATPHFQSFQQSTGTDMFGSYSKVSVLWGTMKQPTDFVFATDFRSYSCA